MKTFVISIAVACVALLASCKKSSSEASRLLQPTPSTTDTTTAAHTDTLSLPSDTPTSADTAKHGSFNGVSSKNSHGTDEILGFDDDVDDDNGMDSYMNDYHDN